MQILEDNFNDFGDIAKRILALREKVQELLENREVEIREVSVVKEVEVVKEVPVITEVSSGKEEELVQEIDLLNKKIKDRENTIKELGFKLEMFKMAKNIGKGSASDSKSEELKQMITEYIKEIDKSIASLNIE